MLRVCVIRVVLLLAWLSAGFSLPYIGCYEDSYINRVLEKEIFVFGVTPEKCMKTCEENFFQLAGVESGFQCFCGNTEQLTCASSVPDSECQVSQCPGNISETCGGLLKLAMYSIETKYCARNFSNQHADVEYMDSNSDGDDRAMPGTEAKVSCHWGYAVNDSVRVYTSKCLNGKWTVQDTCKQSHYLGCIMRPNFNPDRSFFYPENTPNYCAEQCSLKFFEISGSYGGPFCFCGNYTDLAGFRGSQMLSDRDCQIVRCPGDTNKFCGGFDSVKLFNVELGRSCPRDIKMLNAETVYSDNELPKTADVIPGTTVKVTCSTGYRFSSYGISKMAICSNGIWIGIDNNATCLKQNSTLVEKSYIGCYQVVNPSRRFERFMTTNNVFLPQNSPTNCGEHCLGKGHPLAGMEGGVFCICGRYEALEMGLKVTDDRCSIPCPGNNELKCGGGGFISVYESGMKNIKCDRSSAVINGVGKFSDMKSQNEGALTGTTATVSCNDGYAFNDDHNPTVAKELMCINGEWSPNTRCTKGSYLGCFQDNGDPALRIFDKRLPDNATNTPESCRTRCEKLYYQNSGVQVGNQCFCGNETLADIKCKGKMISDSLCDWNCPGLNQIQMKCGGFLRMSIYTHDL